MPFKNRSLGIHSFIDSSRAITHLVLYQFPRQFINEFRAVNSLFSVQFIYQLQGKMMFYFHGQRFSRHIFMPISKGIGKRSPGPQSYIDSTRATSALDLYQFPRQFIGRFKTDHSLLPMQFVYILHFICNFLGTFL